MRYIKILSTFLVLLTSWHSPLHAKIDPTALAADWQYHEAKISPDGKHLAIVIIKEGKRRLAVVDSSNFQPVGGADFGDKQEVGQFYWVSDERLVIKVLQHQPWDAAPAYYGELFAIDYDGRNGDLIYGYRAGEKQTGSAIKKKEGIRGWADIISLMPDDEDHILISSEPMDSKGLISTVHRLNVNNGRMSGILATAPSAYTSFYANRQGEVVAAVGLNRDADKRVFLYDDEQNWTELSFDDFGEAFEPLTLNSDGSKLYVLDNLNQDLTGLFSLDLKTGKREHIYTDEKVDITEVQFSSDREDVYALLVDDGYPAYVSFNTSTAEAKLYKELIKTFQGYRISITSRDRERKQWLIYARNDLNAGSFYLFNSESNQFKLLFANFHGVDPNLLSQSIPVSFAATDGATVNGYVTYPAGVPESQSVPLVVLVHGGPHGVRDYWGFDREVQLLASQGYAVLRVNFRGSGGYGQAFFDAGFGKWGDLIQQDIIDGTKWVIAQGGIDANKVCIMGTSFGAYSAVQASLLAPDLYKCAVANAGIYDLPRMFDEGDIPKLIFGEAFLEKALGMEETKLKQFSPVYNLDKLKAPVLIAHGRQDVRAPFSHAEALKEGLEALDKPYDWFVKDTEAHGFYNQENRAEYFEKVVDFLGQHLK
ncbi:MAG: alpha/beta hydrolase family protein [Aestuariibacter sp.]